MTRAIELARLGIGKTSPNPMVGCVIVHDDKIIAEGFHEKYGEWHAERNAILKMDQPELLPQSTVYVTLEPCAHHGKTPPCSDLIVERKPKRVVVSNLDPNPLVAGKGLQKIIDAGIEVTNGVLETEGYELNKRFFTSMVKKRPYIILKWAETQDGFIARSNYDSKWISNEKSRTLVHQWRAEEDAIMVATNTAIHDNPKLNVRMVQGRDPLRVVLDKTLRIPRSLHIWDHSQKTIIYNQVEDLEIQGTQLVKLDWVNVAQEVMADLGKRGVGSIIIEGGTTLLNSLLETGLWDEARVFVGNAIFESGIAAPVLTDQPIQTEKIADDTLKYFQNSNPQ